MDERIWAALGNLGQLDEQRQCKIIKLFFKAKVT